MAETKEGAKGHRFVSLLCPFGRYDVSPIRRLLAAGPSAF